MTDINDQKMPEAVPVEDHVNAEDVHAEDVDLNFEHNIDEVRNALKNCNERL